MMDITTQRDRIRGSLIGGAIGDALGYPVEFIASYATIQSLYGERGITRFHIRSGRENAENSARNAWISDDTQMTLFTACGLLNAKEKKTAPLASICEAYIEWLYTQSGKKNRRFKECWIREIPELNQCRAPGHTCITALQAILCGNDPLNNSKGCGGVMRIAPIPLYGMAQAGRYDIEVFDRMAAEVAEITHQHPLGYIPAALLSHVIYRLATDDTPTRMHLTAYIEEGLTVIEKMFPDYTEHVKKMQYLVKKAVLLSGISTSDVRSIENEIGGGWVAEETVAIALYCALAHFESFEEAMIAAVNHAGDSDSTGAVTGSILGAAIGYEALPSYYKENLELHDVILHVADDLWRGKTTPFNP